MSNIRKSEDHYIILSKRFIEDETRLFMLKTLSDMYSLSIPVGFNDNGFIYNKSTQSIIDKIKNDLLEYCELAYPEMNFKNQ